jgi:hypothetical protein
MLSEAAMARGFEKQRRRGDDLARLRIIDQPQRAFIEGRRPG